MGIGVEYVLMQMIAVRGGYHVADSHGYDYGTIGAGLRFMHLEPRFLLPVRRQEVPLAQHLPGGSWTLLLIRTSDGPNIPDRTGIQTRFDEKECIFQCTLFRSLRFRATSSPTRRAACGSRPRAYRAPGSNPSCPS